MQVSADCCSHALKQTSGSHNGHVFNRDIIQYDHIKINKI